MVQGQVFLKGKARGGGRAVTPFLFNFFKFFQGSPLPFAKLCYAKKKKKFCHHNFVEKGCSVV